MGLTCCPTALAPRLADLEREFADCEARLADPEVVADQRRYVEISRRYSELRPIVERTAELRGLADDLAAARELGEVADGDERESLRREVVELEARVDRGVEDELKLLLRAERPLRRAQRDRRDPRGRGRRGGEPVRP